MVGNPRMKTPGIDPVVVICPSGGGVVVVVHIEPPSPTPSTHPHPSPAPTVNPSSQRYFSGDQF